MPPPTSRTAVNDSIARLGGCKVDARRLPRRLLVSAGQGIALTVPSVARHCATRMVADRSGDTVRVSFDLLLSRTRRPEKFEAIMRSTLPQVYGALADSALRALPAGAVARAGDLVTTLPERGFRIPLADGPRDRGVAGDSSRSRWTTVVAYRAVGSR
jgi:hypothetical protein